MKANTKTKEDLLKELKSLQRKVNRLEKINRKSNNIEAEKIHLSEEKYHNFFEQSFDGLYITSPEGKILDINKCGLAMLGYENKEEVYNLDLATEVYSSPADRERILSSVNSKGSAEYRVEYKKKNGEKMIMNCSLEAVKNNSGKINLYRGIIRDISEQMKSEKELRLLNRELRTVSKCIQTILRAVDEKILLNEICRIICDEAGYSMVWVGYAMQDEAKTVHLVAAAGLNSGYIAEEKLTWADNTENGQALIGKTIRTGEINYVQDFTSDPQMAPWKESNINQRFQSGIALPLKDENDKVFGILQINSLQLNVFTSDEIRFLSELSNDLTFGITALRNRIERKRMETEIRETEERFQLVFENVFDGISIFSEDPDPYKRKLIDCNKRYALMAGRTREELLSLGTTEGLYKTIFEDTASINRLKSLENETAYQGYFSWIRPDGKENIIEYLGKPIIWRGMVYSIGIDRDITEQKIAERKLEKYSRELKELNAGKDKLFSIIAHDLKSPFNPLLGFSEFILNNFETLLPEEIKNYNKEIYNSLKNEYTLLENLLNWSRLEIGQMEFEPEKINIYDKTESVISLLSGNAKLKGITIVNETAKDIFVSADINMLQSVLQNLISNAIKFTNKTGLIKVSTDKVDSDLIQITISDNGVGMTSEQTNKLFGLTAASTKGTNHEKGTGLGLMICKEMVERHEGTIFVHSELGKGTKISFTLPEVV
jgi:PAS domain S-box-containing protein